MLPVCSVLSGALLPWSSLCLPKELERGTYHPFFVMNSAQGGQGTECRSHTGNWGSLVSTVQSPPPSPLRINPLEEAVASLGNPSDIGARPVTHHPRGSEMASHCGLGLNFPDVEHIFTCVLAICISYLEPYVFILGSYLVGLFAFYC